jgi:hypothetical protein
VEEIPDIPAIFEIIQQRIYRTKILEKEKSGEKEEVIPSLYPDKENLCRKLLE